MYIENIEITGIRNFKDKKECNFIDGRNLISGLNGSGKTSVLESIYLLGYGKSFLNVKKDEILNENSSEFFSKAKINSDIGISEISYHYNKDFSMFVNEEKIKVTDVVNYFFPVYFSSSNYTLYIENISYTRKMINRFIYGIDSIYTDSLLKYGKILKQKKFLLKNRGDYSQLKSWNILMSKKMFEIIKKRDMFIKELNKRIENEKKQKGLKIRYSSSVDFGQETFSSELIYNKLESVKRREMELGRVLIGTHLDKIDFVLNDRPLKYFSSGEKKLNLIIIYLAYFDIFKKIRNEYPLFLIDDFDVAMDSKNIEFLSEKYPSMQIIATSVNESNTFENLIDIRKN